MKLEEFYKELEKINGYFLTANGEPKKIVVWRKLIRHDGFSKTLEKEFKNLPPDEFAKMARHPVSIVVPKKVKVSFDGLDSPSLEPANEVIEFYPAIDEGDAYDAKTEMRVHLVYYEK